MIGTVKYSIIGTGFAGTCALWHLVQRLTDARRLPSLSLSTSTSAITITTVEQGPVNGPGYPYAKDNAQLAHRCNNEASTRGINEASTMRIHGNDFIDWMVESKPWPPDGPANPPTPRPRTTASLRR
ncbi:FAD/NAD(P)-binding protein [Streptomyces inhibens]|uniref:FAD/NAD(P)-binding protein n=1 Tax=Streptomyces inhibens TaxID=2293571 RepID=UPI0015F25FDA